MDPKSIQSIWSAYQEVQEKKKAPVTKKDDDGEGMDPVGKEDGDIDNDGDKDSSDEYLANRRKAVGKAMKKDDKKDDDKDVKESEESPYPSLDKKKREKKGSNLEPAGGPADKLKGESVKENDEEEGEKEECPKCKGEGCDHCDGKGYHMAKKETYGKKKMKESSLFTDAELEAIEEKAKQPNDSGTKAEPFMSTNSEGEKKFYGDHKKSEKKFEDMEDASEKDGSDAGRAVKSQSPKRRGENRAGDIAMPTPTKAKGQ